jgi:hypothetical protein
MLAPGDAKYCATEATLSPSAATTRSACTSELHNRRHSECSALNNLRTANVGEVSAHRYLLPYFVTRVYYLVYRFWPHYICHIWV